MLKDYCIESSKAIDSFVGIRFINGIPQIQFPYGYIPSEDDKECRKDIFRLINVLQKFSNYKSGECANPEKELLSTLPLASYQYLIHNFLSHGYLIERDTKYISANRGKINWKRTIQQEQPQVDETNLVYLNFQIKTNYINDNNLLTNIHKYCVYESFVRFGWLYFPINCLPAKPQIKFNKTLFLNTLHSALNNTFNDSKRKLFESMINIVINQEENIKLNKIFWGVEKFDFVWEKLVDYVFGEENKADYFPRATWHIIKENKIQASSALEPDTIMKYNNKIYVLDAKYYKYGITGSINNLPPTSSIQKQITYGKHIIKSMNMVNKENVYNAFIMPFSSKDKEKIKFIGIATADWEKYDSDTKNYPYVLGILLDTRWLITKYMKHSNTEIEKLAEFIENSLIKYRKYV